jgi:hypothetical protein
VSAAAEPGDPGQSGSGPDKAEALSALEEALRQVLATLPRDQVMKRIAAALPAETLIEDTPRLHGGKVRKVSVSMPEELTEAVRARTGAGGFSRYVADAVSREIRHDLLGDLLEELDAEYGPVPEDIRAETRRMWPDYDEE